MNRRDVLTGVASTTLLALAGCSGDSPPETTTANNHRATSASTETTQSLPVVDVSATDASAESADVNLRVRWRARAQHVLDPAGEAATVAEDGHKWLVVQVSVTNDGETAWDTTPVPFVVDIDGEQHEVVTSRAGSYFGTNTLDPRDGETGWIAFHIPRAATSATVTLDPDLVSMEITAQFEEDDSLTFEVGQ
jgi:hypothetical protein